MLPRRIPPRFRGLPILGVLPKIWRDPLGFFGEVARECGDVARIGTGTFTLYLVSSPDAIGHIFQGNAKNYWKGKGLAAAAAVMGQGLVTSEGELWERQHRLIQPAFGSQRLAAYLPSMHEATLALLDRWRERSRTGEAFDLADDMRRLTLQVICRILFNADWTPTDLEAISSGVEVANDKINRSAWNLFPVLERLPTPLNRRFRRALATLDDVVYGKIRVRRAAQRGGQDLLAQLLEAKDPKTDSRMSDRQLRDEIVTLFIAGHDTPANALSWTFYLLARHPDWAQRTAEEANHVLSDCRPVLEVMERLDVAGRVLKESMRLYPPAWMIVRTPFEDDVLGGYPVPAGAPILLSQYVVHRHPSYWDNPEIFDPERWTPERSASRHRFAYFPFGGGGRFCTAHGLAMILGKLVVAMAAREFHWREAAGRPVVPQPLTTLRPKHGVWVQAFERRRERALASSQEISRNAASSEGTEPPTSLALSLRDTAPRASQKCS